MESGPRESELRVRLNGFASPLHLFQVLSWVVFAVDTALFSCFALPLVGHAQARALAAVLYALSAFAVAAFATAATACNPVDPHVKLQTDSALPAQQRDSLVYCLGCHVHVYARSKHCKACNKCVHVFDHHCKWINNCVGHENYRVFLALLLSVAVMTTTIVGACLYLSVDYFVNEDSSEERREAFALTRGLPKEAVLVMHLTLSALNTPFFVLDMQLLVMHALLIRYGLTTYDYILSKTGRAEKEILRDRSLLRLVDCVVLCRCGGRRRPPRNAIRRAPSDASQGSAGRGLPGDGAVRPAGREAELFNEHIFSVFRGDDQVPDDFINGGWSPDELVEGGGKGGGRMAFVGASYVVKELSAHEHRALLQVTGSYEFHLQSGPSLLCPLYLHFRDASTDRTFVAMRNSIGRGPFTRVYDLKGCADDKLVEENGVSINAVHKRFWNVRLWLGRRFWSDERRRYYSGKLEARRVAITMTHDQRADFLEKLRRDTEWLTEQGLMDYSLLVALKPESPGQGHGDPAPGHSRPLARKGPDGGSVLTYVCIIDFLAKWTLRKQAAGCIKALETRRATVAPRLYASRFYSHFERCIVVSPLEDAICVLSGEINDRALAAVVSEVGAHLEHRSYTVRAAANDVLVRFRGIFDRRAVAVLAKALSSRLRQRDPNVKQSLLEALSGFCDVVDQDVIVALVAAVSTCVRDEHSLVKGAAVRALVRFAEQVNRQAIAAVVTILEDEDWVLRLSAVEAVASLARNVGRRDDLLGVVKALAACLYDRDDDVRRAALVAMAEVNEIFDSAEM